MVDLQKASLTTNGQQVTLTMPISKVDVEKRIVSGFATLDNIDRQGDRVTAEASQKAFENFRGNVSCTGPRACYDESKRFGRA